MSHSTVLSFSCFDTSSNSPMIEMMSRGGLEKGEHGWMSHTPNVFWGRQHPMDAVRVIKHRDIDHTMWHDSAGGTERGG